MLNIDELIFSCSAPAIVSGLLSHLEPLQVVGMGTWKGLDATAVFTWAGALLLAFLNISILLVPQIAQLRTGRDILCGGSTDCGELNPLWSWRLR